MAPSPDAIMFVLWKVRQVRGVHVPSNDQNPCHLYRTLRTLMVTCLEKVVEIHRLSIRCPDQVILNVI